MADMRWKDKLERLKLHKLYT